MAVLENRRLGDWLLDEEGRNSRRKDTIASGVGIIRTGMALGRVLIGTASAAAFAGNAANTGIIAAVVVSGAAKAGTYRVVMIEPATNAGKFIVEDPDGVIVGTGTVGVEFVGGGLTFTVTDGTTDFIAGEGFNITVAAGSLKLKPWTPAGTDGTQILAAFLVTDRIDATAADADAVIIARDAVINPAGLSWGAGVTTQNHKDAAVAQARSLGIQPRALA